MSLSAVIGDEALGEAVTVALRAEPAEIQFDDLSPANSRPTPSLTACKCAS